MPKPKKLNLSEIWELYILLKPALDDRDTEKDLLDEISKLLELSPSGTLVACLHVLYDNINIVSGEDALMLFIQGLDKNEFYTFVEYIKVLK